MNLSISHDSEVEAFAFPFLFLEVSPALDAINGYGKTKSNAFTTPNLKGLLVVEQIKKEESRRRRNEGDGKALCFRPRRGRSGVEVIGEWVKKRESGGVGRDPVGSTDPEVSRISHPCTL